MKVTAVIMAGGKGERFWPKSRAATPKQFLALTQDGVTMIQHTVNRILPFVDYEDILVVTNADYMTLVREQIPRIPEKNILAEPMPKNTAPCVGLAAELIRARYGDAIMLVLPSDHLITFESLYMDTLAKAVDAAGEDDNLVTVGLVPTYPETGYGYIHFIHSLKEKERRGVYPVERFVEKPDAERAREYVNSGDYLWNSGMFIWKASSILQDIQLFLPEMYAALETIRSSMDGPEFAETLRACYAGMTSVSIDYGIMEKAAHIYTVPGTFGWDDVGSWLSMERINRTDKNGNMLRGDVVPIETENSIIFGDKRLIAAVGVDHLIVVDTPDALLICDKGHAQDVKKVIGALRDGGRRDLL